MEENILRTATSCFVHGQSHRDEHAAHANCFVSAYVVFGFEAALRNESQMVLFASRFTAMSRSWQMVLQQRTRRHGGRTSDADSLGSR